MAFFNSGVGRALQTIIQSATVVAGLENAKLCVSRSDLRSQWTPHPLAASRESPRARLGAGRVGGVFKVVLLLSWVLGCEAGGSSLSLRWRGARRGGWRVPISSGAGLGLLRPLRGSLRSGNPTPTARANLAFPNDRGLAPAPDGASCEKCPPIRPCLVVDPSGAAFWACYRVSQRLYNHHPRAQERVRCSSQLGG